MQLTLPSGQIDRAVFVTSMADCLAMHLQQDMYWLNAAGKL